MIWPGNIDDLTLAAYVKMTYNTPAFGDGVEGHSEEPVMLIRIKWRLRWGKKRIKGSITIRF
jgi:hypothetical protein